MRRLAALAIFSILLLGVLAVLFGGSPDLDQARKPGSRREVATPDDTKLAAPLLENEAERQVAVVPEEAPLLQPSESVEVRGHHIQGAFSPNLEWTADGPREDVLSLEFDSGD